MWIKKFLGTDEEEDRKEQESKLLTRRRFLFMMPGLLILPEIIQALPTIVPAGEVICRVSKYPDFRHATTVCVSTDSPPGGDGTVHRPFSGLAEALENYSIGDQGGFRIVAMSPKIKPHWEWTG